VEARTLESAQRPRTGGEVPAGHVAADPLLKLGRCRRECSCLRNVNPDIDWDRVRDRGDRFAEPSPPTRREGLAGTEEMIR